MFMLYFAFSTDQSMKVCTWNDLSGRQCEDLVSDADNFNVVGITALRPITRKGSSEINLKA